MSEETPAARASRLTMEMLNRKAMERMPHREVRKQRYYIDVTFSSPLPYRKGAKGLQQVLDCRLIFEKPIWAYDGSPYIDKLVVVEKR